MTLNYGWVHIERGTSNALQLACGKPWQINVEEDGMMITHIPGDSHISVSGIEEVKRTIKLKDVYFKTRTDFEDCLKWLRYFNNAGTMTLELAYSATPDLIKFWSDGTSQYTSMEVKFLSAQALQKVARESGTVYKCISLEFEQGG